jgi:hypothetical protein
MMARTLSLLHVLLAAVREASASQESTREWPRESIARAVGTRTHEPRSRPPRTLVESIRRKMETKKETYFF